MSIRVRALCTRSVAAVAPETLRNGISDRLPALAAYYGEEGDEDALARLRVDPAPATGRAAAACRLRYQDEDDRFIRVQRRADRASVTEDVAALRHGLADCDEEGVEDVRALLDDVVEIVEIDLEMDDVEGIGWTVAIAAAACFADQGGGLVQADGEGWMAPEGRGVVEVIDGD